MLMLMIFRVDSEINERSSGHQPCIYRPITNAEMRVQWQSHTILVHHNCNVETAAHLSASVYSVVKRLLPLGRMLCCYQTRQRLFGRRHFKYIFTEIKIVRIKLLLASLPFCQGDRCPMNLYIIRWDHTLAVETA